MIPTEIPTNEYIVQYIRPHWLKKLQAFVWYALLIVVPLWLVRVLNETERLKQISVVTLSNIIIGYIVVWFIGLLIMMFRKHTVQAFLTNTRLVLMRGATARAVEYNTIEKAIIWYPTHLARLMHFGSLTLSVGKDEARMQAIYKPEAILEAITELGGIQPETIPVVQKIAAQPEPTLLLNPAQESPILLPAALPVEAVPVTSYAEESEIWVLPEVHTAVARSVQVPEDHGALIEMHEGEAVYF